MVFSLEHETKDRSVSESARAIRQESSVIRSHGLAAAAQLQATITVIVAYARDRRFLAHRDAPPDTA